MAFQFVISLYACRGPLFIHINVHITILCGCSFVRLSQPASSQLPTLMKAFYFLRNLLHFSIHILYHSSLPIRHHHLGHRNTYSPTNQPFILSLVAVPPFNIKKIKSSQIITTCWLLGKGILSTRESGSESHPKTTPLRKTSLRCLQWNLMGNKSSRQLSARVYPKNGLIWMGWPFLEPLKKGFVGDVQKGSGINDCTLPLQQTPTITPATIPWPSYHQGAPRHRHLEVRF